MCNYAVFMINIPGNTTCPKIIWGKRIALACCYKLLQEYCCYRLCHDGVLLSTTVKENNRERTCTVLWKSLEPHFCYILLRK